jgi:hypothetical protein
MHRTSPRERAPPEGEEVTMWTKRESEKPLHGSSSQSRMQPKGGQRSAASTQPLKPSSGITHRDAELRNRVEASLHQNAARAAKATDILEEMNQPRETEGPSQMQELIDAVAMMAEALARVEKNQKEILSALARRA